MAKVYVHRFTVSGTQQFPMDMLRYDRCWPRTGDDAAVMQNMADPATRRMERKAADIPEVELLRIDRNRYWRPEEGRWRSFGWVVLGLAVGRDMVQTEEYE